MLFIGPKVSYKGKRTKIGSAESIERSRNKGALSYVRFVQV